VLDERGEPAGIGVSGELYISGIALARGYWSKPALTAERFLPDPFSPTGARMYRTGDLARWRDDGALEFLGRADEQFKLRGFRVEPAEVETALRRHPQVRQGAAALRQGPNGPALVAYVVPQAGAAPSAAELREFLAQQLPHYMVPSAFVTLLALPLTATNKLDRRSLPAPSFAGRLVHRF
jgi:acyl-coenzyme A synthetase/AMP-(fatty) acid ligase